MCTLPHIIILGNKSMKKQNNLKIFRMNAMKHLEYLSSVLKNILVIIRQTITHAYIQIKTHWNSVQECPNV